MLVNYCSNLSMEMVFMNTENGKTNEPREPAFNLSQRLDLRSLNKHVALQNLSVYCTWKNISQQYKNNELKIIAPTCRDEFELSGGSYSVSHIQDYIEYIIKKPKPLPTTHPIHIYINRIDNRLK